ncbi:hypothetical protein RvY_02383 [Ramazzottius varieornatus]|uniref:DDE-1 domain-containing protein n=1 Tax=Ramazzottius varieornatus TaxID=947166 RepID=A0A1D1UJH9_RAMVA|nr:hypothetical protein RvY_02383 [Ramazzottius varieornatus]
MALFSGKRHVRSCLDGTGGHCYQGVNDSGTMDQMHFASYIKMIVFPAVTKMENGIFVDRHFSHINNFTLTKYIKEFEAETGKIVYVFALPAGQTNHLQPFDVSVFGQVKRAWGDFLRHRRVVIGGLVKLWSFKFLWNPPK